MKRTLVFIATLSLCLISSHASATKLYKWTDEKGQVYYGQTRPANYEATEVNAPPPPPSDSYDLNKEFADQIRGKGDSPASPSTSSKKGDTNAELCEKAKTNLNTLENNARIRYRDEEGRSVVMPDETKKAKLAESKEQVKKYCK